MRRPIVTYLCMSEFRVVRLPPLANVPAERKRLTNTLAVARDDKPAMRPFAKLLLTLVIIVIRRFLALNDLLCDDVPSRNRSLTLQSKRIASSLIHFTISNCQCV